VLVGHSMGGAIALEFTLRDPARLVGLIRLSHAENQLRGRERHARSGDGYD